MRKLLIATVLISTVLSVSAQNIAAYSQSKNNTQVDSYTLPRTIISVTVTQEREVIIRGPYARYASQYLGVIGAPQTDKESYKILDASISFTEEPDPLQTYIVDEKSSIPSRVFHWLEITPPVMNIAPKDNDFAGANIGNQNPFTDIGSTIFNPSADELTVDRNAAVAKNPEQMAADAAATIFKLRKKRIELICAEQGENVFGAGLDAALKEIDRLEKEYLTLFIGKRYTQTTQKIYYIVPDPTKNKLIACRFTPAKGLTDETDLSGSPLYLEFALPKGESTATNATRKASGRTIPVRIPQVMQVKLSSSDVIYDSKRIPVYQFGALIQAPVI